MKKSKKTNTQTKKTGDMQSQSKSAKKVTRAEIDNIIKPAAKEIKKRSEEKSYKQGKIVSQ